MHKILTIGITGATGNLGRRLVHFLAEQFRQNREMRVEIKCLVRSAERLPQPKNITVTPVLGDVTVPKSLTEFVQGLDVCIHLASLVGFASQEEYQRVNVTGTQNLCQALQSANPSCRLIHCSSIAVLRRNRWLTWLNTDYANSKQAADQVVEQFRRQGMPVNIIYPGLIYGPEDTHFIPTLAKYLKSQKVIFLSGGEAHCPAIFIDDLCSLFNFVLNLKPANQQNFIGVGPQELGIHGFIAELANCIAAPVPTLKLPKMLLLPIALLCETWYRWRGVNAFPVISKRSVDLLSINLSPALVKKFNGETWHAKVYAQQGLQHAVAWCLLKNMI